MGWSQLFVCKRSPKGEEIEDSQDRASSSRRGGGVDRSLGPATRDPASRGASKRRRGEATPAERRLLESWVPKPSSSRLLIVSAEVELRSVSLKWERRGPEGWRFPDWKDIRKDRGNQRLRKRRKYAIWIRSPSSPTSLEKRLPPRPARTHISLDAATPPAPQAPARRYPRTPSIAELLVPRKDCCSPTERTEGELDERWIRRGLRDPRRRPERSMVLGGGIE